MRPFVLFPLVCTSIALILAFLAVFAGTNNDMMETYDMVTLNTSRIGVNFFNQSKHNPSPSDNNNQHSGGFFSNLFHNATAEIHNLTGQAEQEIQDDLNKVFRSLAKDLGLKDFYSVHVLNHCEGFFKPNTTARNVTHCTNATGLSSFNATATLAAQLNSSRLNVTLAQLHWPDAITQAEDSLKLAFNVSFVLFVIALIFTAIALLAAAVALFADPRAAGARAAGSLNLGLCGLACFALAVASIITTVGASKIADAVNTFGKEVNVTAARGDGFIALAWAGTALMGVAALAWMGECFVGRRQRSRGGKPVSEG